MARELGPLGDDVPVVIVASSMKVLSRSAMSSFCFRSSDFLPRLRYRRRIPLEQGCTDPPRLPANFPDVFLLSIFINFVFRHWNVGVQRKSPAHNLDRAPYTGAFSYNG
jgi:hypothetical protein